VFVFNQDQRVATLRVLGRHAADPRLSLNWYDAAQLSERIRYVCREQESGSELIRSEEDTEDALPPAPRISRIGMQRRIK
ncbi:MAG: hypothetical protein ACK523_00285, partial [Pirellulaceae bacterium]